jgi:hypothetical protein
MKIVPDASYAFTCEKTPNFFYLHIVEEVLIKLLLTIGILL